MTYLADEYEQDRRQTRDPDQGVREFPPPTGSELEQIPWADEAAH